MAISLEFLEYVIEMLIPLGNIESKRMFGGALLLVDGVQLGIVSDDTLYFTVISRELRERLSGEGASQFSYTKKSTPEPVVIKKWWEVPAEYLDNGEALCELAEEVLGQETSSSK